MLTQEAELSVLYETEEGPAAASRRVSLSHRLPGQGEGTCLVTTELLRDPTAALAGEGVEVSFALAFRWMCLTQEEVPVITQVQVGEPRQAEGRQPPSPSGRSTPGRICGQWPKPAAPPRTPSWPPAAWRAGRWRRDRCC